MSSIVVDVNATLYHSFVLIKEAEEGEAEEEVLRCSFIGKFVCEYLFTNLKIYSFHFQQQ